MYVGINNFLGCWIHEDELNKSDDVYINKGLFKINIFCMCVYFSNKLYEIEYEISHVNIFGLKDICGCDYKICWLKDLSVDRLVRGICYIRGQGHRCSGHRTSKRIRTPFLEVKTCLN